MGNHRAARRGHRETAPSATAQTYVGRRVAGRSTHSTTGLPVEGAAQQAGPTTTLILDEVARTQPAPAVGGRRKAQRRTPAAAAARILPPTPVLVGVATLAVAFGGAATNAEVASTGQAAAASTPSVRTAQAANALGGSDGGGTVDLLGRKNATLSRDSSRQALAEGSGDKLVAAAEQQAQERNAALAEFAAQAEQQAAKIAENQWQLPLSSYRLTATFGQVGLWASYHTGLDFAAPTGTPIMAVANGTVTSTGYDGSYGNKTVVTLDDGTELWFCHQTTIAVSVGESVTAGQVIGTVGSTGNTTGPHLHLEVRPGAGDPVDPYSALQVHGLNP